MKKTLTTLAFLCMLVSSASAQWYLYPGSAQQKKEKAQQEAVKKELDRIHGTNGGAQEPATEATAAEATVTEPGKDNVKPKTEVKEKTEAREQKREPWVFRPKFGNKEEDSVESEDPQVQADTCIQEDPVIDEFVLDIPETINIALLLPLKSSSSPSSNFMDYYSGALMATRELGKKGFKISLNVFDTADASTRITDGSLAEADVILGPVATAEIRSTLERCPEGKFIVSPMEPKAAALTETCNVIQVPATTDSQIDELIGWIRQDMRPFDRLVVVKDASASEDSEASQLFGRLEESGMEFSVIDSPRFDSVPETTGTMRVVIISERDSYLCSAVNAAGKTGAAKGNLMLYSTSKLRSLEGINAESLFNAQCHMVSNYFIDYTDQDIKDFILAYRALFKAEPSSFSFNGYDTMYYFVNMCAEYGRQWYKKLPEKSWEGLQNDFRFMETETAGKINGAIRRVVYRQDLSIALQ